MATAIKKSKIRHYTKHAAKLPKGVAKQLEKIYSHSKRTAKKHPYHVTGGVLLTLGLASGTYFLIRNMMRK